MNILILALAATGSGSLDVCEAAVSALFHKTTSIMKSNSDDWATVTYVRPDDGQRFS